MAEKCMIKKVVLYLQINHEFYESLAVMHLVHGYRPCGKKEGIIQVITLAQEIHIHSKR